MIKPSTSNILDNVTVDFDSLKTVFMITLFIPCISSLSGVSEVQGNETMHHNSAQPVSAHLSLSQCCQLLSEQQSEPVTNMCTLICSLKPYDIS